MGHRVMAWTTLRAMATWERLKEQRGQGTVEYVGILVMVALLVGGVGVAAKGWGGDIGDKLKGGLIKAIGTLVGEMTSAK